MSQLQEAINKTIEYGLRFGVNYTGLDVKERLISRTLFNEKDINKIIEKFPISNKQFSKNYKNVKIEKAKEFVKLVEKYFNSILLITITGSVAAGYPNRNDDIDLMIITKKDSLWLTRLEMRLFVWWYKIPHRVYGGKEVRDQFCFNLWLEENSLIVPKNRQTLQNAMDSILMIPVLNRYKTYEKFFRENVWIKRFVASGYTNKISDFQFLTSNAKNRVSWVIKIINWLVFWPQWCYMRRRIKSELVNRQRAFFHPNDRI